LIFVFLYNLQKRKRRQKEETKENFVRKGEKEKMNVNE